MSIIKRLLGNKVGALQFYNLSRKLTVLVIAILLAKSFLNTQMIGVYELLLFMGMIFSFFWVEGILRSVLILHKESDKQHPILFNSYIITVLISSVVCLILHYFEDFIIKEVLSVKKIGFYSHYVLYLLISIPTLLIPYFLLVKKKEDHLIRFTIIAFSIQLIAIAIALFWFKSFGYFIKVLIVWAAALHLYLLVLVFQEKLIFNRKLIRRCLYVGFPIAAYALFGSFSRYFDSWFVNYLHSDIAIFAKFRYGAREFPFAAALIGGLSAGIIPALIKNQQDGLQQLKMQSLRLYHVLFPIGIILILSSYFLFPILFSEAFRYSSIIFNVYMLLLISQLILPQSVLMAREDTQPLMYVALFELAVNILCTIFLGLKFGLIGIAFGTLIAFIIEKIILAFYLYRKHGVRPQEYVDFRWWLVYSCALITAFIAAFHFFQNDLSL